MTWVLGSIILTSTKCGIMKKTEAMSERKTRMASLHVTYMLGVPVGNIILVNLRIINKSSFDRHLSGLRR